MFGDTIIALNKGATVAELNEKLSEVVAAVRATAKAGSITLTLKLTPGSKGNADMVFIEPDIKTRIPTEPKGSTLFFTTEDNKLSRYNDKQRELEFDAGEVTNVKVVNLKPELVKEAM